MFEKVQGLIKSILSQEYVKASIYYVIANIIGQGVVLLSSAIFTRMMSKNDYGLVSTYSTWVLILNTFICLNLFITVRNAYIDICEDYDKFNSSILTLNILSGLVISSIIIIGVIMFAHEKVSTVEVVFACVQSISLNIINYMMAILSMKNQYKHRSMLMIAPNWTHIVLSVFLMCIFTKNLYLSKIAGNAVGLFVFAVICSVVIFYKANPVINIEYWKYALRISIPSIFNTLSDLVLIQCDRLMLTAMVGAEETAEYSIVYNVGYIIVMINQAVNGAWTPWFYRKLKDDKKGDILKYQRYYILGFAVFTCGMMTVAPECIKFISPVDYWDGINYVSPIIVSSYIVFIYAFFTIYMMYKKHTGKIARNTILVAVMNLLLNYILIPEFESVGAVIATIVSYVSLFLLHFVSIDREGHSFFSMKSMLVSIIGVSLYGTIVFGLRTMWLVRYMLYVCFLIMIYLLMGKKIIYDLGGTDK